MTGTLGNQLIVRRQQEQPCSESIRSPPVLLARDLAAARESCHGKLGLVIEKEDQNAIVFRCGGGTHLDVTKSSTGTAGQQTQAV